MTKIAISTDGTDVSAHFGRCPSFTMLEIENDTLVNRELIPNPGHETGFLPRFFRDQGVNVIIAGGMGRRAIELFSEFTVQPIMGISGPVDDVVDQLLAGTLQGGESSCVPKSGSGYGIPKKDGHGE